MTRRAARPALTADDALVLSRRFRDLSTALGDYRYRHWKRLTPRQRQDVEALEWALLNHASDMLTAAVGLALDEAEGSLEHVTRAAARARRAVRSLGAVRKVVGVAAAAAGLSAAILARDPAAIGTHARRLLDVAGAATDRRPATPARR